MQCKLFRLHITRITNNKFAENLFWQSCRVGKFSRAGVASLKKLVGISVSIGRRHDASVAASRVLLARRRHTGVAKINKAQIAQPLKKNEREAEVKHRTKMRRRRRTRR